MHARTVQQNLTSMFFIIFFFSFCYIKIYGIVDLEGNSKSHYIFPLNQVLNGTPDGQNSSLDVTSHRNYVNCILRVLNEKCYIAAF